jgi:hypothetical protein
MSATPLLDGQILRLRRRIGDMFNEDGSLIDTTNVYASTSGVTWKQQELLDIYNDSIRQFMIYLVKRFSRAQWWEFLPGYVYNNEGVGLAGGKLDLSTLTPSAFQLIDCKNHGTDLVTELGTFIPPNEWFDVRTGFVKTRKPDATHIFYTVMADDKVDGHSTLFLLPSNLTSIDLIYLKDHTDFVQNSASDLNGISQDGLRRVLMYAEAEARRYKSTEAAAVSEANVKMMMDMDAPQSNKGAS